MKKELKIYNTLTKKIEAFVPNESNKVGIYVCGMTVYDHCHIGHARIAVTFDYIVRYMCSLGYDVKYVRNITDIDDKIINKAKSENVTIADVTEKYIKLMHEDFDALGCLRPNIEPKATEHIKEVQKMIYTLLDSGYAYHKSDGVYFSLLRAKKLGQLSNRTEFTEGDDFVLWKNQKSLDEPMWTSPILCDGRPGWHSECAAMSRKYLGKTIDIHGGGADLIFPHHENEILQSEAVTGQRYVNNWMHVGHITVNGNKMAKSIGNFTTIRDVISRYDTEVLRYYILNSHYRTQLDFDNDKLNQAEKTLYKMYNTIHRVWNTKDISRVDNFNEVAIYGFIERFHTAMQNDFNLPEALAVIHEMLRVINKKADVGLLGEAKHFVDVLIKLSWSIGILQQDTGKWLSSNYQGDDNEIHQIENLINERKLYKLRKDFALADIVRMQLLEDFNVILEDDKLGNTTWRKNI